MALGLGILIVVGPQECLLEGSESGLFQCGRRQAYWDASSSDELINYSDDVVIVHSASASMVRWGLSSTVSYDWVPSDEMAMLSSDSDFLLSLYVAVGLSAYDGMGIGTGSICPIGSHSDHSIV